MSIIGRMQNDGMSFEEARMKEGCVSGASTSAIKLTAQEWEARFTEHLDAWKANNAFHAARIAELEGRIQNVRQYLIAEQHNLSALLLYPPLNAVAYRALQMLETPK